MFIKKNPLMKKFITPKVKHLNSKRFFFHMRHDFHSEKKKFRKLSSCSQSIQQKMDRNREEKFAMGTRLEHCPSQALKRSFASLGERTTRHKTVFLC